MMTTIWTRAGGKKEWVRFLSILNQYRLLCIQVPACIAWDLYFTLALLSQDFCVSKNN